MVYNTTTAKGVPGALLILTAPDGSTAPALTDADGNFAILNLSLVAATWIDHQRWLRQPVRINHARLWEQPAEHRPGTYPAAGKQCDHVRHAHRPKSECLRCRRISSVDFKRALSPA